MLEKVVEENHRERGGGNKEEQGIMSENEAIAGQKK